MNTVGLASLVRMGNCLCLKEIVNINGRTYCVRESLGEGGFSTVDLVEDTLSHRLYALKRITCHSPMDQKLALCEVEYHSVLQHPNILTCSGSDLVGMPDMIGSKTSQVFLLLPYCPRGTLHEELVRRAPTNNYLDEGEVLRVFHSICLGVQHMHNSKPPLAHRDLKTANILLKDDLTPLIMDLGSTCPARVDVTSASEARILQDTAAERSCMTYRAPELFNVPTTCKVDERTDVWSLGCLLHALCFFRTPYDAVHERGDSVALAVIAGKTNFPEGHPYSQDVCELIVSLLQVEPEQRPFMDWVVESIARLIDARSSRGQRSAAAELDATTDIDITDDQTIIA
uniref:non-specific serine/threonine protein kinase n=2 Tax=Hirondellea gigas TaxID=1518452 RepID=A0A6A7FYQ3_9CRUS